MDQAPDIVFQASDLQQISVGLAMTTLSLAN